MVSSNNDSNKSKSFHTHPWFLELNNDDRALAKRIYKLIEQVQVNETEIDSIQRKSAVAIVEKEELDKKLEAVTASKDKVMALYTALQNRNEELREESAKQTLEEKTRREELSESFSSTISEITARMDKDTQDRLQVLARNEALKQELRDHEEHIQNFLKTYEQQYTTLETEHRMLELKKHFLIERFEKDSAMLPELEEKEKEARELHDTKKSELQDLTNNFEKLQKDISDSTQWFQKHQSEIDRLTKRLKILDTERQDAYKKMQKAEKESLAIIEEKEEAGNQLKRIESATVLLQQQIDTLKNEVRDQKTPGKE